VQRGSSISGLLTVLPVTMNISKMITRVLGLVTSL